jgi:hypothetical protein
MSSKFSRWNIEQGSGDEILVCTDDHEKGHPCEYRRIQFSEVEAMQKRIIELENQALQSGEPVAWQFYQDGEWYMGMPGFHRANTIVAGFATRDLYTTPQPPTTKPIAAIKGWFHGECVIQALDPEVVLPAGMALYAAPQRVVPDGDITPFAWMRPEDAARTMIAVEGERAEVAPDKEHGFTVPLYRCHQPVVDRNELIELLIATRTQSEGVTADLIIKLPKAGGGSDRG